MVLVAIVKNRLKREPIILADVGSDIAHLAKELGIKPKVLASVLTPIYKEAVNEAFTAKKLKKSAKRGPRYHHDHHHGH